MFKNQADGRKNLVGLKMQEVRKSRGISQRQVADDLNEMGLIIDKNQVSASSRTSSLSLSQSTSISR